MTAALEFKPRVRALPDLPPRRVRERHTPVRTLGLLGWALAVSLGFGIDRGYLPVKAWAAKLESADTRAPGGGSADGRGQAVPRSAEPNLAGVNEQQPAPPPAPMEGPLLGAPVLEQEATIEEAHPEADEAPPPTRAPVHRARAVTTNSAAEREPAELAPPPLRESTWTAPSGRASEPRPRRAEVPDERQTVVAPAIEERAVAPGASSCEAAVAAYSEEIVMGRRSAPDLTREHFAAVLENGSWFQHCALASSVRIDICVAVRHGRAVGVTVNTVPRHGAAERCVAAAARRLSFPSHERLDVTRTTFSPE